MDDVELEAELRRAAELFDPPPAAALRGAAAAYTFRTIDAELAELTFDSLADDVPAIRGPEGPRVLTFGAGTTAVELEIADRVITGQLLPAGAAEVEVRCPGRTIAVSADELGRFTAGPLPPGPVSLRCHLDRTVVTDWISIR